jgi:hypothetical protein
MPSLRETQAVTLAAIRGGASADAAAALLRGGFGLPPERRLQVYRHNHFESLIDALEAVYPVVHALVGEAFFRAAARRFVRQHPPREPNLHRFGAALPAWFARWPAAAPLPYLADVARLEWAVHEAVHEADAPPLDPARLAAVPPELQPRLRLRLHPATRFIASAYPLLRIWQTNQPGAAAEAVALDEGGVRLQVARRAGEVELRRLGAAEDRWLRALARGADLEAATLDALAVDAGFDLPGCLARHVALGSFAALSLPRRARPEAEAEAGARP